MTGVIEAGPSTAGQDTGQFPPERASTYDHRIRRLVPGYDDALDRMVLALCDLGPAPRILIVGSGTGAEIVALAAALPDARLVGVDPSPAMLAEAEVRLAEGGLGDSVALLEGTVAEAPPGPYDAAVCHLVTHFIADDGRRGDLLSGIAERLATGATLSLFEAVGIDHRTAEDDEIHVARALYGDWLVRQGSDPEEVWQVLERTGSWPCVTPQRRDAQLAEMGLAPGPARGFPGFEQVICRKVASG